MKIKEKKEVLELSQFLIDKIGEAIKETERKAIDLKLTIAEAKRVLLIAFKTMGEMAENKLEKD